MDLEAQTRQRAAQMRAAPPVQFAVADLQDITQHLSTVGSVEAPLSVKIAAKITGRVDHLASREGDRVTRGEVLVRMDPAEVEAQVRQARAGLAEAQYRLAQARAGQNPTDVSVASQVRQQEAALRSAQADYNQVQENYQAQVEAAEAAVTNLDAGVRSAQANLNNARAKYKRIEQLYQKGFIAAQDVDDAKTAVGVQEAALDAVTSQRKATERQAQIIKRKGTADIDVAAARLEQARAALASARANTAQTSAYQQSIAALEASVAAAQAGVRSAEARRADTILRAPFNGFVTGRFVDPGAVVTTGQPILSVQFMREVWVTTSVPEESSGGITLGQPAVITLDALRGRTFTGRVTQINPSADPESRQFQVRVTLDNRDFSIKPGTFAHVRFETGRARGEVVVPREAVQHDQAGAYVMVIDERSIARRRPVSTGTTGTDVIGIAEGVRPGDKVITLSAFPIRDGQLVVTGGRAARRGRRS